MGKLRENVPLESFVVTKFTNNTIIFKILFFAKLIYNFVTPGIKKSYFYLYLTWWRHFKDVRQHFEDTLTHNVPKIWFIIFSEWMCLFLFYDIKWSIPYAYFKHAYNVITHLNRWILQIFYFITIKVKHAYQE